MVNKKCQIVVIGAGPAGCAAAIQLKRNGLDVILIDRAKIGGLARNANFIENYLGLPTGITGVEFCYLLENHLKHLEVETVKDEILEYTWNKSQNEFIVKSKKNQYECQYLVVASGTRPRKLGVKGEDILRKNKLIYYEPAVMFETLFYKKKILVIGSGDAAFDYSLNIAAKDNHSTILSRTRDFKALPLLVERAQKNDNIEIKTGVILKELKLKEEKGKQFPAIKLKSGDELDADFILVAVGREPNHIKTDVKLEKLVKEHRICFIGDLVSETFRQISIAAGHGIRCAMRIANEIRNI